MIRINLLGTPRQKKGKRGGAAPVSIPSDGPPMMVVLLIVGLLTVGGNYMYYRSLNAKQEKLLPSVLHCSVSRVSVRINILRWMKSEDVLLSVTSRN